MLTVQTPFVRGPQTFRKVDGLRSATRWSEGTGPASLMSTSAEPMGPTTWTTWPRQRWSVIAVQLHQLAYQEAVPVRTTPWGCAGNGFGVARGLAGGPRVGLAVGRMVAFGLGTDSSRWTSTTGAKVRTTSSSRIWGWAATRGVMAPSQNHSQAMMSSSAPAAHLTVITYQPATGGSAVVRYHSAVLQDS